MVLDSHLLHLKKAEEFSHTFSARNRLRSGPLKMNWVANDKAVIRVGFALSKKSLPRAVDRNRVRRVIKEYIRLNSVNDFAIGYDLVFSYYGPVCDNDKLRKDLERVWTRLHKHSGKH